MRGDAPRPSSPFQARSLSHSYPDRFAGDDLYHGRYIFTLGLDRFASSAVFTVFVPAFVIVLNRSSRPCGSPGPAGRAPVRAAASRGRRR